MLLLHNMPAMARVKIETHIREQAINFYWSVSGNACVRIVLWLVAHENWRLIRLMGFPTTIKTNIGRFEHRSRTRWVFRCSWRKIATWAAAPHSAMQLCSADQVNSPYAVRHDVRRVRWAAVQSAFGTGFWCVLGRRLLVGIGILTRTAWNGFGVCVLSLCWNDCF